MPTNYYPEDEAIESEESAQESETSLLPKSMFGGDLSVGDTVTLKIVHLYEDEAEVEVVDEEPSEQPQPEEPISADQELDTMGM